MRNFAESLVVDVFVTVAAVAVVTVTAVDVAVEVVADCAGVSAIVIGGVIAVAVVVF